MPAQKDNLKPRRPGRPRGSKPDADKREQLIDIALQLFSQQGVARTSLNAIAREAGSRQRCCTTTLIHESNCWM